MYFKIFQFPYMALTITTIGMRGLSNKIFIKWSEVLHKFYN